MEVKKLIKVTQLVSDSAKDLNWVKSGLLISLPLIVQIHHIHHYELFFLNLQILVHFVL